MRLVIAAPAAAIAMVMGRWLSSQRTMTGPPARGSRRPTMSKYDHQKPKPTDSAIRPVAIVSASRSALARPSTTPKMTSPRTMIVNRSKRSISECVGVNATPKSGNRPNPISASGPCDSKRCPHDKSRVVGQQRAGQNDGNRGRHPADVDLGRPAKLRLVLCQHREPLPAHDREQQRIDHGEGQRHRGRLRRP